MEPFEVELVAFKYFFPVVKSSFTLKKEKHSLSDLSHDVRKPFSANKTFITFSFILESQLR